MTLKKALVYALSLPERALRSTAAALGGVSKLMTDTLLPKSVRGLTFYKYFVGNTQKFLIESIGDVRTGEGEKLPDDYLPRKIVGNLADVAGIFAFHFSPVWFFALVGDAASGTQGYLRRVTAELEKDGAIPAGTTIDSVDRLLEALAHVSATSAMPIDTPPLSAADLRALKDEIASSYTALYRRSADALPSLDTLWDGLMEIRRREKLPLLKVSGAMAFAATKAAGKATGGLFYEKILLSYAESISEVRSKGFVPFFSGAAKPYLDAVSGAFSVSKKTLIGRWLGAD
ncbi:MAG TPA: hypothetical protein VNM14_08230 [Planctomycetota bacterium]|nr:hypothetical protein [Planctomycetota bacterium]